MKPSTGRAFIEQTKYKNLAESDQRKGLPQPPLEKPFAGAETLELPPPEQFALPPLDFPKLIRERTSVRKYADEPIPLETLAFFLWATQGVKQISGQSLRRTVPSASARHAFETCLLVNRVEGLAPGLYRYLSLAHKLGLIESGLEIGEKICRACSDQSFVLKGAATFIWTAVPYRMTWRSGERGYRSLYLDAGHVCQNLYLAAESAGCGACAIGAFDDDVMNGLLGLDGENEFTIYCCAVGKKPGR